jgi:hypothetical protein
MSPTSPYYYIHWTVLQLPPKYHRVTTSPLSIPLLSHNIPTEPLSPLLSHTTFSAGNWLLNEPPNSYWATNGSLLCHDMPYRLHIHEVKHHLPPSESKTSNNTKTTTFSAELYGTTSLELQPLSCTILNWATASKGIKRDLNISGQHKLTVSEFFLHEYGHQRCRCGVWVYDVSP